MALFNRGQHSFNKKYERFSDVYKQSTKYRKRTRTHRTKGSGANEFFLPSRRERFGKKRASFWGRIWSVFPLKYIALIFANFRGRMRVIREARTSAILGYIPTKLFLGLCVITCGLYPYIWMWGNAYAFNTVGDRRINESSVKRLAVLGFMVQLLLPIAIGARIAWRITGAGLADEASQIAAFVFL